MGSCQAGSFHGPGWLIEIPDGTWNRICSGGLGDPTLHPLGRGKLQNLHRGLASAAWEAGRRNLVSIHLYKAFGHAQTWI